MMDTFTIVLPDTNVYNLHDLIVVADAAKSNPKGLDLVTEFRELLLLADDGNGPNNIAIGGSDVSDTVYSYKLTAGASKRYSIPKPAQKVYCKELYVKASAGTPTLHVEGQS